MVMERTSTVEDLLDTFWKIDPDGANQGKNCVTTNSNRNTVSRTQRPGSVRALCSR